MTAAFLPPEEAIPDLQRIIEDAIRNDPRNLQTALGPSDIACACDPCLINMIAISMSGEQQEQHAAWLPTQGKAVHEWLEMTLLRHLAATGTDRYILEGRVTVGQVGGVDIEGNSDVFDTHTGTVIDYKLTGTTTLRDCKKNGAKLTYRRQVHMYGLGWRLKGYDVRSVAIWYLPRNGFTIGAGYLHQEPYDEQVAVDALARADMFAGAIATFGVDQVLAMAPAHTGTEFSCPAPEKPLTADQFLLGAVR